MGNCCLRRGGDSAAVWADDDEWIGVSELHQHTDQQKLLWEDHHDQFRSSSTSSSCRRQEGGGDHQVKITITKRELEELVRSTGGGAGGETSVEQLLDRAINVDDCDGADMADEENQVPWRPALQSIPEIE